MYLVVVCNCCLKYWLIFYMLNIHGTYNVWLCVVYEILLNWLAPSVTNLLLNYKYLESMWLQYCNRLLHTCHENIYSILTTYLIRYCYECVCVCVRDIHVWSTSALWNVTPCSMAYLFQCFRQIWCRQQVPAEYRYYNYMVPHPRRP